MRESEGISVQRAIMHLVDAKSQGGYVLSDLELPLESHGEFATYLADHIHDSLHDQAARTARFDRTKKDAVLHQHCTGLLLGKCDFVQTSRSIASHLYSLLSKDKRISSGLLVVCFYSAQNIAGAGQFLAILKLDPSKTFQPSLTKDQQGHKYITVKKIPNAVPSAGERLQKCAFIRYLPEEATDYEMMILDLQKRGIEEPAQFFTTDFLAAELFADPQTLTKNFYVQAMSALGEIRTELGPAKAETVKKAIDAAVQSEKINVDEWVNGLRIGTKAKAHMKARITPGMPDAVFSTDEKFGEKLTRMRVFKGAYDLKLSVNSAYFDKVIVKQTPMDGYTEIVIHATDLREVP